MKIMGFENASLIAADVYRCVDAGTCGKGLRLALLPGETIRAPEDASALSVLVGNAWVSYGGEDLLLDRGERLRLGGSRRDPAVNLRRRGRGPFLRDGLGA